MRHVVNGRNNEGALGESGTRVGPSVVVSPVSDLTRHN